MTYCTIALSRCEISDDVLVLIWKFAWEMSMNDTKKKLVSHYYHSHYNAQHYHSYGFPKHPEPRPSFCQFHNGNRKDGMLPFLGTQLLNRVPQIKTKVYVKPTNTGLLVHYQSHVDNRYKRSLLTTMLDRAYHLSSSWLYFSKAECERLKSLFSSIKTSIFIFEKMPSQKYFL